MTFEQYLGEKKLKESTRKKYLSAWYKGVNMKTVENHYIGYLTHICPGQSPDDYKFEADNRKFCNVTSELIYREFRDNLKTLGREKAWEIRQRRSNMLHHIEFSNNDAYYHTGDKTKICFAPKTVMEGDIGDVL